MINRGWGASVAEELAGLTDLLYEIGLLKRYRRTGWLVAGVRDPESIADHSFRTAVIASVIAALEGGNPERAAFMSLFHDTQETRITDIPYLGKLYLKAAPNEEVTAEQVRDLPERVAEMVTGAVGEYEEKTTLEAVCARDADKLECLLQAVEYREQGHQNVQPWIDSSLAALRTPSAKRLADEALNTGSLEWVTRVLNGGRES
ncbi:putative hydrolase of HD superfamily [Streptosporangium becharense]|uniref:5'-deoxynucleotidase n=1 Tax=Streptosporangium becharense TaxID=1816182 RepID=A0A7W9MJ58_9ACTN|nr:HD domain-containing protein [Streptosporangium becharense]MBB2913196.1 putative hydrolase of HD superfamily [Streptosporangium becharense]MBB5822179.1 putative hydrolase of HD superfamily [Streptosporangium becharense]